MKPINSHKKKQRLREEALALWKQIILKRHDYVCELCGGNWKITAHHFYFRSSAGHLIFELDNGICLCGKCHASLHWRGNDQKLVEDKIVKLRGMRWLNRLKKKKMNRPKYFSTTIKYYEEVRGKLKRSQ